MKKEKASIENEERRIRNVEWVDYKLWEWMKIVVDEERRIRNSGRWIENDKT